MSDLQLLHGLFGCEPSEKDVQLASEGKITVKEKAKYFLAIDLQLVRESKAKGLNNSDSIIELAISKLLADKAMPEVSEYIREKYGYTAAVENALSVVKNIALNAETAAMNAPESDKNKFVSLLSIITGDPNFVKFFAYAYLPGESPLLSQNPEVAAARKTHVALVKDLVKDNGFDYGYLLKHGRNALVKGQATNPEQLIKNIAAGKDAFVKKLNEQIETENLGIAPLVAIAIPALISAAPSIISALSPPKNNPAPAAYTPPAQGQYQYAPNGGVNYTGDPSYQRDEKTDYTPYILGGVGILVLGTVAVIAMKPSNNNQFYGRRRY